MQHSQKLHSFLASSFLLIASALCLHQHQNTIKTQFSLQKNWNLTQSSVRNHWRHVLSPNSDRLSFLPPETVAMITMLSSHESSSYRFSPAIKANDLVAQRMVEGSLPTIYDTDSPFYFLMHSEPIPAGCTQIDSVGGIVLARCL